MISHQVSPLYQNPTYAFGNIEDYKTSVSKTSSCTLFTPLCFICILGLMHFVCYTFFHWNTSIVLALRFLHQTTEPTNFAPNGSNIESWPWEKHSLYQMCQMIVWWVYFLSSCKRVVFGWAKDATWGLGLGRLPIVLEIKLKHMRWFERLFNATPHYEDTLFQHCSRRGRSLFLGIMHL